MWTNLMFFYYADNLKFNLKCPQLLSVTLELHSPTILFVIISGYNVPLRYFLIVCYCFCTILNYFHLRKSDVIKITRYTLHGDDDKWRSKLNW